MNKTLKVFLIIAAVMIMTGLVFCVAAIASGNWDLSWRNLNNIPLSLDETQIEDADYELEEYTIDAAGISELRMEMFADDLIINLNQESNDIIVHYYNSKYYRYNVKNTGKQLSISYQDLNRGWNFLTQQWHNMMPIEVEVWLPASFFEQGKLKLDMVSGDIDLNNISGDSCVINSVSGDIQLLDCSFGELEWYSVSGDTLIHGGSGSAHGEAVSGSVAIEAADFSDLEISLISGDIAAELLGNSKDYRIDAESVSGDIEVDRGNDQAARSIDLETTSGDIELDFLSL